MGTPDKTTSKIDLFSDLNVSPKIKAEIKRDVGDFIIEKVLETVGEAKSPIKGESWKALSKDYKAKKEAEGGSSKADMELSGDMLNSLTYRNTTDGVEVGFFDSEAWKADGHLKFSGEEGTAPKRRFLPAEGQEFKADIQTEIERIISDKVVESGGLDRSALKDVNSKSELYDVLKEMFPDLGRAEIKASILRTGDLVGLLDDMGLLEFL